MSGDATRKVTRFSVTANVTQDEIEPLNAGGGERDSSASPSSEATTATVSTMSTTLGGQPESPDKDEEDEEFDSATLEQEALASSYTTQYLKSLHHYLTRDKLPSENHYRNILSVHSPKNMRKYSRPTVEELREVDIAPTNEANQDEEGEGVEKKKGKVVKFGWVEGVFMRCLLNIWGVMLFLRLTWVIGQCGILQGILVITLANVVTFITAISMSAVSTNGQIKAGGIYFMISRSLGPEFGGAIGVTFTVANSIAVATYLIGFCDALIDMLYDYGPDDFNGIIDPGRVNDIRVIGAITLVCVLGLAIVGMEWVTRVQIGLLFLLILSQFDFVIGSFLPAGDEGRYGFVGWSGSVFSDNLLTTNYHPTSEGEQTPTFFYVFGVFFPAVTGIVAGANLSGDLKDPSVAIPKGTLYAIILTYITYVIYGIIIGFIYIPEASGDQNEYWAAVTGNDTIKHFDDCTGRECKFGSSNDQQTMSKISVTGYLVYAGCFAATISSAIASLVGAPRVLQALARDNLYPLLGFFGQGYGANDDPFRGYILVFFISFGCTMIGNLDVVGTLLSNFFVAAYALINFSVFHATITKSPGWRPSFKYYNHWVSLVGTVLCVACMFLMDYVTALITFALVLILYFYIAYRKPEANWGSSTQAQMFVNALKNVQDLSAAADHVKNYRPKILVYSGNPAHRPPLVDFANLITKKLSLLVCANVAPEEDSFKTLESQKANAQAWYKLNAMKAFYSVTADNDFSRGAVNIMNLTGLGKLSPNMVMIGFKGDWAQDPRGLDGYINVLHHGLDLKLGVAILRVKTGMDYSQTVSLEHSLDSAPLAIVNEVEGAGTEHGKSKKVKKDKKDAITMYKDHEGRNVNRSLLAEMQAFRGKKNGFIDVWWLYDDGGLTLLLPYILRTRSQFENCQLRVFALANKKDELDRETRNMAALLAKFRIDYSDVTVIPDVLKKAKDETRTEFRDIIGACKEPIPEQELNEQKEKTNRHLRLAELLREHSYSAEMIIMTLPMPRKGSTTSSLYMSWLEIMTRNMPPFLFVRGNQTSVLTFYT